MVFSPWLPVTALPDTGEYCLSVKTVAQAWPENSLQLPSSAPTGAKKSRVFTGTWNIFATWVGKSHVKGVDSWTQLLGSGSWPQKHNYEKV